MARHLTAVGAALACGLLLSGCPTPNDEGCGEPSQDVEDAITVAISSEGQLRNFRTFEPEGGDWQFVSVEHRTPDEVDDDDSGDIFTFAVPVGSDTGVVAVDERARQETDLPDADFDVRENGAVDSRGCTYSARTESADSPDDN